MTTMPSVAIRREAHGRASSKENRFWRRGCACVSIVSMFPIERKRPVVALPLWGKVESCATVAGPLLIRDHNLCAAVYSTTHLPIREDKLSADPSLQARSHLV